MSKSDTSQEVIGKRRDAFFHECPVMSGNLWTMEYKTILHRHFFLESEILFETHWTYYNTCPLDVLKNRHDSETKRDTLSIASIVICMGYLFVMSQVTTTSPLLNYISLNCGGRFSSRVEE